jgi:hypothetical protein
MFQNTVPDPAQRLDAPLRAKPRLSRGYVAGWSVIGCLSAAYIGQVAWTSGSFGRGEPVQSLAAQNEVTKLRQTLGALQHDLSAVRVDLEQHGADPSTLANLAAIEERTSMVTGIAVAKAPSKPLIPATIIVMPPVAPEATPIAAAAQPAPAPVTVAAVEAAKPAAPAAAPAPIPLAPQGLDKMMAPIETGSILPPSKLGGQLPKAGAAPANPSASAQAAAQVATTAAATTAAAATPAATPITFGPPVVKAAPKPFAVQLASGTTVDEIRLHWSLLADQHGDALRTLQPRYTATGTPEAGQTYDLIAGPVKTAADAKRICKQLAARGADCKIAQYQGDTF